MIPRTNVRILVATAVALLGCLPSASAQSNYATPYTFTTLAGESGFGSDDGVGTAARFYRPTGLALDSAGNLYVSDTNNHTIRKITPAGVVTTVAGIAGVSGYSDGSSSIAQFVAPGALTVDAVGNVYLVDGGGSSIRKLLPSGGTTRVNAYLQSSFYGLTRDAVGTLYYSDGAQIFKIPVSGSASLLAGSYGGGAVDGTGVFARFNVDLALAVDGGGNVFVADRYNQTIRKITPGGVVTTLAGFAGKIGSANGTGSAARFSYPSGLAVDGAGNVYVADMGNSTIRKVTPQGVATTVAGSPGVSGTADGSGAVARFESLGAIVADAAGNIFVTDGNRVRKITAGGVVTTVAGRPGGRGAVDEFGSAARFATPNGITVDAAGMAFVADGGNSMIRRIGPDGGVYSPFGTPGASGVADGNSAVARFRQPYGMASDSFGNLLVTDASAHTIRKISPQGLVTTWAGIPDSPGSGDGPGFGARFSYPMGIAVRGAGPVYVADRDNSIIRIISPTGVVSTFAGQAGIFGSNDGNGSSARFNGPTGVAVDGTGNVYVADFYNHTVRKITPAGDVSTLAGFAGVYGSADGAGDAARFNCPSGVAVGPTGEIFVADYNNTLIRKISPGGIVTTIAGRVNNTGGGAAGHADGTGEAVRFSGPWALAFNGVGQLLVTDSVDSTIRIGVVAVAPPPTIATQPVNQTVNLPGTTTASFSVTAGGTGPFTYQWRKDGGAIEGATNATLALTNVQSAHAGSYTVDVTNAGGTVPSAAATLTVNVAPTITSTPPGTLVVNAGAGASLTVAATGTAPFTYQWSRNGTALGGATSATYAITNAQTGDAGSYSVVVTNAAGNAVYSATSLAVNAAAAITTQPASRSVVSGQNVSFSVTAAGAQPLSYQWKKAGVVIAGATNPTFTIVGAQGSDAGAYTVDVTNVVRTVTSSAATLTVNLAPVITQSSSKQTVNAGSPVNIAVNAIGDAPLSYKWYQWSRHEPVIPGATSATYTIPSATAADAGDYSVEVTNAFGTASSSLIGLVVNVAPAITSQPQGQVASRGASASFFVEATGAAPLRYQWRKNGAAIAGATGATLNLANVQPADAGSYSVLVSNMVADVPSNAASLLVNVEPTISGQPANRSVNAGASVFFGVTATGALPLAYQWSKDGVAIPGATSASYTIDSAKKGDAGNYSVLVSNTVDRVLSAAASLTVTVPVTITDQPVGVIANAGAGAAFAVKATGDAPLSYQWRKNGTAIGGATNASYSLTNVQDPVAGTYSVVVGNVAGSVTSVDAALVVVSPPAAAVPGEVVSFVGGGSGAGTDGTGSAAQFNQPSGIARDYLGNLYVADTYNHTIRKVTPTGIVTTLAGLAGSPGSEDGTGNGARFRYPWGVAVDGAANVFVADTENHTIRKITPAGVVSTVAGLALNQGSADGPGGTARFVRPWGIAVDAAGILFVADQGNSTIRRIAVDGTVSTFAGSAGIPGSADGPGAVARFNGPGGIALDAASNLIVADSVNHTIRKITPAGVVSTVAGLAGESLSLFGNQRDGIGQEARFNYPLGVAIDSVGYIYVTEFVVYHRIRRISPSGAVTTVAGTNAQGFLNGPLASALFNRPAGIAVDAAGNLYVTDLSHRVRLLAPPFPEPPSIATPPLAQVVNEGEPFSFSVTVSGPGPFTYQWLKDGVALNVDAARTNSIGWVTHRDNSGRYSVVVGNYAGTVTSDPVDLIVRVPPAIAGHPVGQTVAAGQPGSMSVAATGTTPLGFQWKKNGTALAGATNSILNLPNAQPADAGSYTVTVTNVVGSVTSNAATFTVNTAPVASTPPAGIAINAGRTATLNVLAAGLPAPSYQWRKDGNTIPGATTPSLVLSGVHPGDAGGYTVTLTNSVGTVTTSPATVTVRVPPRIVTNYVFSLWAGTPGNAGNYDGPPGSGAISNLGRLAVDASGNVFLADPGSHVIRKILPDGTLSTYAGLANAPGVADGAAGTARFNGPQGAVFFAGDLFVADSGSHTIRKIDAAGDVTTFAGAAGVSGSVDGSNGGSRFNAPADIAQGLEGDFYVADRLNHTIRKIRGGNGGVVTFAGTAGAAGYVDGIGAAARFDHPSSVTADALGNVYVAEESSGTIRKISPDGAVSTLAGLAGVFGAADGVGNAVRFSSTLRLAADGLGNVLVADSGNHTVRLLTPEGAVTTIMGTAGVAGNLDGPSAAATVSYPVAVATDAADRLYVASNYTIRRGVPVVAAPAASGSMLTFSSLAGAQLSTGAQDGAGNAARFSWPEGVAVDGAGSVFVADSDNFTIRKITPAGVVTTFAGTAGSSGVADGIGAAARFSYPTGLAFDPAGNLIVTDWHAIRRITPAGAVSTVAGLATSYGYVDGTGSSVRFSSPAGVAVDAAGNIFVTDTGNHVIRRISVSGNVTTLAGSPGNRGTVDGFGSVVRLDAPYGITIDADGTLYFTEPGTNVVRRVTAAGAVSTLAGAPGVSGRTDGVGSSARFNGPRGILFSRSGDLLVADAAAQTIRRVSPGGTVTTVAGRYGTGGFVDGAGGNARFREPAGLAEYTSGNLIVTESSNKLVRVGTPVPGSVGAIATTQVVRTGQDVTLAVRALGSDPLTYQWRKGGTILAGATSPGLTLFGAQTSEAGDYTVTVSNDFGSVTSAIATVAVLSPPTITTQPANVAVNWGQAANFSVLAAGAGPLNYQWRKDGAVLFGETGALLSITSEKFYGVGAYSVTVSNPGGSVTSAPAALSLNVEPRLVGYPQPQTVTAGQTATFSVEVSGTPPLTYQWSHSDTPIPGATSATLSIPNAQPANAGIYQVVVSNAAGTTRTGGTSLLVNVPPSITAAPVNRTPLLGQQAIFSVTASGTEPLTYQWTKDGSPIPGAAGRNYFVNSATLADAGEYAAVVSNSVGAVTSASATLSVFAPPVIVTQPVSQTVMAGANVTFTFAVNGATPLNYQWFKNGGAIAGATASTLVLNSVQPGPFNNYYAVVTNPDGNATSVTATLTVHAPLAITMQPQSQTVNAGASVNFSVGTSGTPAPTFQWRKGGTALPGATNATLALGGLQPADAGSYDVVATNTNGSVTSNAATLAVNVPPTITTQPSSQTVVAGTAVTFTVAASGTPAPTLQWKKNGADISGATNATLALANVQSVDAADYTAVATNAAGSAVSGAAKLTINVPPVITVQPQAQTIGAGQPVLFSVSVSGNPPPTFQWRKGGVNVAGATSSTLAFASPQFSDAGSYDVVITNAAGSATSAAVALVVNSPPSIVTHPIGGGAFENASASLTVVATGTAPLAYEWKKDGGSIAGATGSTLTLASVQSADQGAYTVVVTNAYGSVTSNAANFSVSVSNEKRVVMWGSNSLGQTSIPAGATTAAAIATGRNHTLALKANGTVVAWGSNSYGETTVPAGLSGVTAIAAGNSHSLALKSDGTVAAWGQNANGECNVPAGLAGVIAIGAGNAYSIALKSDGTVAVWGIHNPFLPETSVRTIPAGLSGVTAVAAGQDHVLALKSDGTVVAWGMPWDGQTTIPTGLSGVTAISAGVAFSVAVKSDGTVVGWGKNDYGQITIPAGLNGVVGVDCGLYHTLARKSDGSVVAWGYNFGGQINVPAGLSGVIALAGGELHSAALTALTVTSAPTSQIVTVGQKAIFQIKATGAPAPSYQWRKGGVAITGNTSATTATLIIESATAGDAGTYDVVVSNSAVSLTSSTATLTVSTTPVGLVMAWGSTNSNQTPVPAGLGNVKAISAGGVQVLALKTDGTVTAWGSSGASALNVPANLTGVVAVAAGSQHSLALKSDGTIVPWGLNTSNQAVVPSGTGPFSAIAAGATYSLGLTTAGGVVAWGNNFFGQTNVPGSATSGVTAISAGANHALALKSDGTVVAWGDTASSKTAIPAGLTGVVAIAAGSNHSLALKGDGTVVAWGYYNGSPQTTVPAGLTGVVAIAAGNDTSFARKADGNVVAWGSNTYGQTTVPAGITGVVAIAAGGDCAFEIINPSSLILPVITKQPVSVANSAGFTTNFTVNVAGVGPMTYQWRKNGVNISGNISSSDITSTLSLPSVSAADVGTYDVIVSNSGGSVTSTVATFTLTSPAAIATQPANRTFFQGQTATLSVVATGTPTPTFQWRKGGTNIAGATNATLTFANADPGNSGYYDVVVTNSGATVTSGTAMLLVNSSAVGSVVSWGLNGDGQLNPPAGLTGVIAIAAGAAHTVALKSDGTVVNWGRSANFQLVIPSGLTNVTAVRAGDFFSLALKGDGTVAAWGPEGYGVTTWAAGLTGVSSIAAGTDHAVAVKSNGTVVAGGRNDFGQTTIPAGLTGATAAAAGVLHTFVLKSDGTVVAWGHNGFGQSTVPAGLSGVTAIASGAVHSVALKNDGTVVAWGANDYGQSTPPAGLTGVVAIAAGYRHTVALKADGTVVAWGLNTSRQCDVFLGLSGVTGIAVGANAAYTAALIGTVTPAPVIAVAPASRTLTIGQAATFSVTATGPGPFTYQWRKNGVAITGNTSATTSNLALTNVAAGDAGSYDVVVSNGGGSTTSAAATLRPLLPGAVLAWGQNGATGANVPAGLAGVTSLTVGDGFTVALRNDGSVALWGSGPWSPAPSLPARFAGAVAFAAREHLLALKPDGTVEGMASLGGSGPGAPPAGLAGVVAVAAGIGTGYALKGDGTVAAWGDNSYGQTTLPAGLNGVKAIAAGLYHVLALKADGTVAAWGRNTSGECTVPAGLAGVIAIAAGNSHSVALKSDGSVVAWGDNFFGQRTVPAGLAGVTAIAAGGYHTVAMKSDGSVVGWGRDVNGQSTTPVGLSGVIAIAAGSEGTFAIYGNAALPPAIASHPSGATASAGQAVSFTVSAAGSAPFTYQWRRNGTNLTGNPSALSPTLTLASAGAGDAGSYDVVVSNAAGSAQSAAALLSVTSPAAITTHPQSQSAVIGATVNLAVVVTGTPAPAFQWRKGGANLPGATSATLALINIQAPDFGSYDVVVSNAGGSVTSNVALLTANFPPVITAQPLAQTVLVGDPVTLTVTADGAAPLAYQWRRNTVAIPGAATASLALATAADSDSGSYDVVVSNAAGNVTSDVTLLAVVAPPVVTTQPGNQIATAGATVSFTVAASGTAPLSYQWKKNGATMAGATNSTLTIANVQGTAAGGYSVVVVNPYGSETSATATLAVNIAPVFAVQPQSQTLIAGAAATLTALATGSPAPTYQWRKGGIAISGATHATLVLGAVQLDATGSYDVVATSSAGTVTSTAATLTVHSLPTLTTQPQSRTANVGATVTFDADATGTPAPTYQWKKGTLVMAGATNATLTLANVQPDAAATYTVVVTNAAGSIVSSSAVLIVNSPPTVTLTTPVGGTTLTPGVTTMLSAMALPAEPTAMIVAVQFRVNGVVVGTDVDAPFVLNWTPATPGSYALTAVATDSNGLQSISPAVNVTVGGVPTITTQPAPQTGAAGTSVTFTVVAASSVPMTYQWRKGGVSLTSNTSATTSSLILTNVSAADAGSYDVVLTNAAGSVTSSTALLTVTSPDPVRGLLVGSALNTVTTGPAVLIGSFTIEGAVAKQMLIRAIGPGLGALNVSGLLVDPQLEITNAGTVVAANDDWSAAANAAQVSTISSQLSALPLASGSKDAVVLATLPPGTYCARVTGAGGTMGSALLEIYDADTSPRLVYLSTRAQVLGAFSQSFAVSSPAAGRSYLIRALGPSLGVPGALADPALALFSGSTLLASNDNWGGEAALAALATSAGAMPLPPASPDAALNFVPVTGGTYSARVAGAAGGSGLALLEIFEVDAQRVAIVPAAIVSQPENASLNVGQPAIFGVVTVGKPAPVYQWRKDGTNIIGATNATFTLAAVQAGDAGGYDVVVTNIGGLVTSASAMLAVSQSTHHSADTDRNLRLTLVELTRVIELYNTRTGTTRTGAYLVQAGTEDGFVAEPARANGTVVTLQGYHSADSDRNAKLSLIELTRVIELYNYRSGTTRTGQYHVQAGTEDGFAPGPN